MVYPPSDDTFLLLECVDQINQQLEISIDIGTGTGVIARSLASKSKYVIATDISPEAIETAKSLTKEAKISEKIDFLIADLLCPFKERIRADIITFNPPYLPSEGKYNEKTWCGGPTGREITIRFLEQLAKTNFRICFLVQSSLSNIERIKNVVKEMGLECFEIAKKQLFFEELVVFKIVKRDHS